MTEEKKEYYVRWIEEHEIRVRAEDEDGAIREALKRSAPDNRSSTDETTAIAA